MCMDHPVTPVQIGQHGDLGPGIRSQAQQAWRSVLGSLLAQQASSALGPCQHVE